MERGYRDWVAVGSRDTVVIYFWKISPLWSRWGRDMAETQFPIFVMLMDNLYHAKFYDYENAYFDIAFWTNWECTAYCILPCTGHAKLYPILIQPVKKRNEHFGMDK